MKKSGSSHREPRRRSGLLHAACILWAVSTALACAREQPSVQDNAVHAVTLVEPKLRTISDKIETFGSIAVRRKTDVTAAVDGIVRSRPFEEGERIASGAVVVELDNVQLRVRHRQAQSEIESAESSVLLAEARLAEARENVRRELIGVDRREIERDTKEFELERLSDRIEREKRLNEVGGATDEELRELHDQQVRMQGDYEALLKEIEIQSLAFSAEAISRKGYPVPRTETERIELLQTLSTQTEAAQLAVARSSLDSARAELDSVELLLDELVVTAPRRGTIGARHVEVGERVQEGGAVVSIFEEDPIHALLPVRESETGLIAVGQRSDIVVPAVSDEYLRGEVDRISPTVDPQSGSVAVRVVVENSEGTLKPGMFVEGSIGYGRERQALVVPVSSLVGSDGRSASVFVVRGGRALRREIAIGEERNDRTVEVEDGLTENELLIDTPSPLIREGDRVQQ